MNKINRLRIELLETQAKLYGARLEMLECEHEPVPGKDSRQINIAHNTIRCWTAYVEKCSKCGKVFRDLTEKEYLKAMQESAANKCNEITARLNELLAEAEDESE